MRCLNSREVKVTHIYSNVEEHFAAHDKSTPATFRNWSDTRVHLIDRLNTSGFLLGDVSQPDGTYDLVFDDEFYDSLSFTLILVRRDALNCNLLDAIQCFIDDFPLFEVNVNRDWFLSQCDPPMPDFWYSHNRYGKLLYVESESVLQNFQDCDGQNGEIQSMPQ
jgi:hypothetical protein